MHVDTLNIGDILRDARKAKELSQLALAEKINVSERTIIALENNERRPSFEILYELVHAMDISADLIFYPDHKPLTTEQDQFIREYMACSENEKRIVTTAFRSLIRALRQDAPEKQS